MVDDAPQMTRRTDIAEVARHARVSKSTVSRVINGGYASAEVKARVGKVIQKLGYTPWTTARNFSLGRAGCVGLAMEGTQSQWITEILGGIESELTSKHISLLVGSLVLRDKYDPTTIESWIRERRVDGLIFTRAGHRERSLIETARKAGVALVLIAPDDVFTGVEVLRSDNVTAGRSIAEHLHELGHRRIGFVGGPKESDDGQQRIEGILLGLAEHRVKVPESNIVYSRYRVEAGAEYAKRWLKMARSRSPTAIVFGNDSMALGFMRTLAGAGVKIPDEVSVVGFDDIAAAGLFFPGLTTIRQEMRAMGEEACRFLLRRTKGKLNTSRVHEYPMKLVVRESTGPAPAV
jgi:LacI family transcriptional regulator